MASITEWQFTADVASSINEILRDRLDLPFASASCEERGKGSQKRRDLTIYDRNNNVALTGEVKLPDKRDGRSPIQEALVIDAHNKANAIGVDYFFTWNVNNCVLWKTFEQGKPITERYVEFFDALPAPIRNSDDLLHPRVKEQVKKFLTTFLERCAAIFSGAKPMLLLPMDEKFIRVWELALFPLVTETLAAISERYEKDKKFRTQLDKWMRDEQGWTLSRDDEEVIRENLERAAKFSCYVLANKIVFYKSLRRQFPRLKELRISTKIKTNSELKASFEQYFTQARTITGDYETVFQSDFGETLPCLNEISIGSWRDLIEDTDKFDFTQFNYEVIGQIFERMLSTSERHKFGQHYTRSEVVDLINAFCIRESDAIVLDPACGGGTFLVRAYQRKSDLAKGTLSHQDLIKQIYGFDISAYPAHLTTINLATRDLKEGANYPLVARKDFFDIAVNNKVFQIPRDDGNDELIPMPKVNVIVGNPPYVRQEKINEYYGSQYKKHLQDLARHDALDAEMSGRSDILCYFFTHGGAFLEDGGYMGLLTSSNWLDTAYGFRLQKFLLDNFEIIAIFESNCEPWFTGARVTTAATILRKQPDATKRNANNVKFIWLKKPIADFLTYSQNESDRRQTFEEIRKRIESLTEEEETEVWRVRVVNQAVLYEAGCLPFEVSEDEEEEEESEETTAKASPAREIQTALIEQYKTATTPYTGYKWGIYLRAPQIFSKLINRYGDSFVPLGKIAEVKRGITSGCDAFFFPRDITDEAMSQNLSDHEFKERYGIGRSETRKVRIVEAGDGSVHLIENDYLEPVIFNLMETDSVEIPTGLLKRKVVLVSAPKETIKNDHILKYIKWGEKEKFHERSTCASRKLWYELSIPKRGDSLWSMTQRYRYIVPFNESKLICNKRLFNISTNDGINGQALCAVLNSTIVALSRYCFGRIQGGDPISETEVSDVKIMLVPDLRVVSTSVEENLIKALRSMRRRNVGHLVDVDSDETNWTGELALEDRQQLDDAVLELIGVEDPEERLRLRDELYTEITALYRQIRVAERKMQRHRSATARAGKQTAHSIADEIWESLAPQPVWQTPFDFIPNKARGEEHHLPLGRAKIVRQHLFQPEGVQIGDTFIALGDPMRCQFVKTLADLGISGAVFVPVDPIICEKALNEYQTYKEKTNDEFMSFAAAYTAEETLQSRVVQELWKRIRR
jgi:type I restriction-modification system DNA methylase subunit